MCGTQTFESIGIAYEVDVEYEIYGMVVNNGIV